MKMKTHVLVAALAALSSLSLAAQEFKAEKNIPYYTTEELAAKGAYAASRCKVDVTWPAGVTNFATVVNIHGGGLVRGAKCRAPWPAEAKDLDPVAHVAVGYRLLTNATPAECVSDAAAAVAWTLKHIAAYGGDPKKVFVTGVSGGGYLTAMIGLDARWLAACGCKPSDLAGIAPLTGQMTKHFNVRKVGFKDADAQFRPKIDEWAPLHYAQEKGLPPACFLTGGRDVEWKCRVEENELLASSLRNCGYPKTEFHETEGDHGGGVKPSSYYLRDFVAKTVDAGIVGRFGAGERVAFVGDSITHGGGFVAYLQLYQNLRFPGCGTRILNAGISGDTAAGGLRRLDADILASRPDRAFVMFGMNDVRRGSWKGEPPAEADAKVRAAALADYAANQRKLADRFAAAGVRTVLMTPSPYDQYSNCSAANLASCNDGLARCAETVRALAAERSLGLVELHRPLTEILKANPTTVFCKDRVHPGEAGHFLMAALVLDAMHVSPVVARCVVDARKLRTERIGRDLSENVVPGPVTRLPDGIAFTYAPKALPLPKLPAYLEAEKFLPVTEKLNREILVVKGLAPGRYALAFDERRVGAFSAGEFEKGVNVALLDTPNQRLALEAAALAERLHLNAQQRRREQLVLNMLAAKGIDPADEAKADAYLDDWLDKRKNETYFKSFKAWVDSYRKVRKDGTFALQEEDLRERLNAVRPRISRLTVSLTKGEEK